MTLIPRLFPLVLLFTAACADVEAPDGCHYHDDELHCDDNHGLATTVILAFTPSGGGDTLSFEWSDPEGDGDPIVDDILLLDASDHDHHDAQEYALTVQVFNELQDPTEDVTPEIEEQAEQHQFFFTGSAVQGPATGANDSAIIEHAYSDSDADGLPIGLSNAITTLDWGTGELTLTLRHMPPENGTPLKVTDLAQEVADGGFASIGGDNDIEVTFNIEVE